jgi:beta-galactosidase
MKNITAVICIFVLATIAARADNDASGPRQRLSMDLNWSFTRGDPAGAQYPAFDDSGWRVLDVPHDWSIEGPFAETNSTGGSGGFLPAGIGWYRKHFATPAAFKDKRVSVQFDGVFMNADVYLNGHQIGHHAYGYTSFNCDLTPFLAATGNDNVLAVRVANDVQPNSRWYTGSGIYRHVWADVTGPIHVANWGTLCHHAQGFDERRRCHHQNARPERYGVGSVRVHQDLIDPAGNIVGSVEGPLKVPGKGEKEIQQKISVTKPQLWLLENPVLYMVRTSLSRSRGGAAMETLDSYDTTIGIRQIDYDVTAVSCSTGSMSRCSACACMRTAGRWARRCLSRCGSGGSTMLKAMGCNAIRCSHNPPAPEFLDLCDRLGFLVMDEAFDEWTVAKGQLHGSYSTLFNQWSQPDLRSCSSATAIIPASSCGALAMKFRSRTASAAWRLPDPGRHLPRRGPRPPGHLGLRQRSLNHPPGPTSRALDIAGYNYVGPLGHPPGNLFLRRPREISAAQIRRHGGCLRRRCAGQLLRQRIPPMPSAMPRP